MRFFVECAFLYLGKRRAASRKGAFWLLRVTEKRILGGWGHGKAHSETHHLRKDAFYAPAHIQSALFRKGRSQSAPLRDVTITKCTFW